MSKEYLAFFNEFENEMSFLNNTKLGDCKSKSTSIASIDMHVFQKPDVFEPTSFL